MSWRLLPLKIPVLGDVERQLWATYQEGNCYLNSFQFTQKNPQWVLVHGICQRVILSDCGETKLVPFGHAWCERKLGGLRYVVETKLYAYSTVDRFYSAIKPIYRVTYTAKEARIFSQNHEEKSPFGPWDKKIIMSPHKEDRFDPKHGEFVMGVILDLE